MLSPRVPALVFIHSIQNLAVGSASKCWGSRSTCQTTPSLSMCWTVQWVTYQQIVFYVHAVISYHFTDFWRILKGTPYQIFKTRVYLLFNLIFCSMLRTWKVYILTCITEEKQLADYQQTEIEQLQRKVSELQGELQSELKHRPADSDAHVRTSVAVLSKQQFVKSSISNCSSIQSLSYGVVLMPALWLCHVTKVECGLVAYR